MKTICCCVSKYNQVLRLLWKVVLNGLHRITLKALIVAEWDLKDHISYILINMTSHPAGIPLLVGINDLT